jgi:hypothetical protein
MTIDMQKLKRMSDGDPNAKVMVNKRWLAEAHRLLAEAQRWEQARGALERVGGKSLFEDIFGRPMR